jgi:DNA primase
LCPAGHVKPLFWASRRGRSEHLVVVEGEINALSLAEAVDFHIVSPGGASEFTSKKYVDEYKKFKEFTILADHDEAGFNAVVSLKTLLLKFSARVRVSLMDRDCNDLLVTEGKQSVKNEFYKVLGVPVKDR